MTADVEVRAEQVRTLYRQGTAIIVAGLAVSLIVTAVLWRAMPTRELVMLPGLLAVVSLARFALHRSYFQTNPPASESGTWARWFVVGSACAGVVWGAAGFWFFGSGHPLAELVVPFAIGGLCAAAAGTISCYLPAFFAFVVPALAGVLLRAVAGGDALHLAMAAMIAVYVPGLSVIAIGTHRAVRDAFRFRFQNEALLTELSTARARLEESNRTLEERVEERSRELAQKADALLDAQRMEAVGRLAGGIAHDFNNLLMVVLGNVNDLLETQRRAGVPDTHLTEVRDAAARGAELVKQLLLFGRRQKSRPETLDLNQVVMAMQRLLGRLIGEHLTLEVVLAEAPLHVLIDRTQLEQIIINLVTNARDAMTNGGTVTIETARVDLEGSAEDISPGKYARLVVSDTGIGMDSETRRRLFEPFFTTKEVGHGTGLGLATVYGIVEQSGGAIRVESETRHGSRFRIYFPRTSAPAEVPRLPLPRSDPPPSGATILLVEDDAAVRAVTKRMLSRAGHNVLPADGPDSALAVASEHPERIHVLVSDVVMPKMSGPELAERLGAIRPGMRTLFMSGYNRGHLVPAEDDKKGIAFLEKPFTYSALVQKVAALIALAERDGAADGEAKRADEQEESDAGTG